MRLTSAAPYGTGSDHIAQSAPIASPDDAPWPLRVSAPLIAIRLDRASFSHRPKYASKVSSLKARGGWHNSCGLLR